MQIKGVNIEYVDLETRPELWPVVEAEVERLRADHDELLAAIDYVADCSTEGSTPELAMKPTWPRGIRTIAQHMEWLWSALELARATLYRCEEVMSPPQVARVGNIGQAIQTIQALQDEAAEAAKEKP